MNDTGERQVSKTIDGVRRDHVARYEWSSTLLNGRVLDLGCGIGYGSKVLSEANLEVVSYDISHDAIKWAQTYFGSDKITYKTADLRHEHNFEKADAAVCFEMIEHLEDPRPLLRGLTTKVKRLLVSVPNEEVFPYRNYAYHHRHYTRQQFEDLLNECGWSVCSWYGQEGAESEVEEEINGRTLIAVCEPRRVPKSVAIVGLGPSCSQYLDLVKRLGSRQKLADEVWAINALGDVLCCDMIFHMDDVRIQEIRAKELPESNIAAMVEWLKTTKVPVMTSRLHPDYPSLVEFPLEDVINELTYDYFNNTSTYALAYAIYLGVEKITIFGCDFTYPNAHDAEKGRGCLEFWLGYAAAKGIKIGLPQTTTLMDACYDRQSRLYGYDTRKVIFSDKVGGGLTVSFEELDELPTAEEIEDRYDHSKHPNVLMEK